MCSNCYDQEEKVASHSKKRHAGDKEKREKDKEKEKEKDKDKDKEKEKEGDMIAMKAQGISSVNYARSTGLIHFLFFLFLKMISHLSEGAMGFLPPKMATAEESVECGSGNGGVYVCVCMCVCVCVCVCVSVSLCVLFCFFFDLIEKEISF